MQVKVHNNWQSLNSLDFSTEFEKCSREVNRDIFIDGQLAIGFHDIAPMAKQDNEIFQQRARESADTNKVPR